MTRKEANLQICLKLIAYFSNNPQIRFTQGLTNLGINEKEFVTHNGYGDEVWGLKDKYHEESEITLNNIKE